MKNIVLYSSLIFLLLIFFLSPDNLFSGNKKNEISFGFYLGRISGIEAGTGPYFSYVKTLNYDFHMGMQLWYKNTSNEKATNNLKDDEINLSYFIDWYYIIKIGVGISSYHSSYYAFFPIEFDVPGFFIYKDIIKLNFIGYCFSVVHKRNHHDINEKDLYIDGGWFRFAKIDYYF